MQRDLLCIVLKVVIDDFEQDMRLPLAKIIVIRERMFLRS